MLYGSATDAQTVTAPETEAAKISREGKLATMVKKSGTAAQKRAAASKNAVALHGMPKKQSKKGKTQKVGSKKQSKIHRRSRKVRR